MDHGGGRDVYVIGNIAAGKTTLTRLLAERIHNSVYVPEPVERNPFLSAYLRDQRRWGMTCMTRYFLDYLREWAAATRERDYRYHFVDAGAPTNRLLYGRYLHGERVIDEAEYVLYEEVCDLAARAHALPEPHAFVYLRAEPDTCWRRMRSRGWEFQVAAVERGYLETLHRYLEEMAGIVAGQGYPLLVVDGAALDLCHEAGQEDAVQRVRRFLEERES